MALSILYFKLACANRILPSSSLKLLVNILFIVFEAIDKAFQETRAPQIATNYSSHDL